MGMNLKYPATRIIHCAFYLMPTMGIEQSSYTKMFVG